jgi:4-amino-4-deoxy-L-arabinose transferase-like glycosyltransferase
LNTARSPVLWIAILSTTAAFLYFYQLGSVTPYLSVEEVSQSRESVTLAATGRNADGERLPVYFPEDEGRTVRDPIWVYWAAALLTFLPFSEALARAPSATAGVLNIILIFLVAREAFGKTRPAMVAALVLLLTPAHFLQSRIATMQIAPVTFALGWLLFLARYLRHRQRRDLVLAAGCLGLGMYSYVAAFVIMPVYLLLTLTIASRQEPAGQRAALAASAVFAMTIVPLVLWFVFHPQQIVGLTGYYTHGEYNQNLGWRGFLGAQAVSHADAWWSCYNPDKLFFSGDPDLRFSTRTTGYFLLASAVPMAVGIRHARHSMPFELWLVLIAGLALAPLPAVAVSNSEIKRWLTIVPFAALATAAGVEWMMERGRAAKIGVAALLILALTQSAQFFHYYFGAYRVTAGEKLGGNLRGAIREVLAVTAPGDCVLFAVSPYYLHNQWDLYTLAYGRTDIARRTTTRVEETTPCPGATALALPDDARLSGWRSTPIRELDGSVRLAVYRR